MTPIQKEKHPSPLAYKKIRYFMATTLLISGIIVIFFGLFYDPQGEVHHSILTLFGEILTFTCILLGMGRGKKANIKKEDFNRKISLL
ncbi:MAG: hypothetical protein Q3998_06880 [Porphyromonas sp.]|nr:hypothetical protein [Porphyromonas sp.]